MAQDPTGSCELFVQHFSSMFSQADIVVSHFDFGGSDSFSRLEISTNVSLENLRGLSLIKVVTSMSFILQILNSLHKYLLHTWLSSLFNAFLTSGIFPSCLKQSFLVPMFKKCDRSTVNNYIPIVIQ